MRFLAIIALLVPTLLRAELPPSAYENLQAKAPEYLRIEVLRVDVSPGGTPSEQQVHVVALVSEVLRSANGVKKDDIINIVYKVTEREKGWVGPGEVPILSEKERTVAYLAKLESGDFEPAAGRMSFSNF